MAVDDAVEVAAFVEYGGVPSTTVSVFDAFSVEVVVLVAASVDVKVGAVVAGCVVEVGPLVMLK